MKNNKDIFEKEIDGKVGENLFFSDVDKRIDYNVYAKNPRRSKSLWMKIGIPVGSIAAVAIVAVSLYAGGVFKNLFPNNSFDSLEASRLVAPSNDKIMVSPKREMSSTTYSSYMKFAKNFTQLSFDSSIAIHGEKSLGVSLPDAYLCFALAAITSTDEAAWDFLSFMGLSNEEELKKAASEVVSSLCTLKKDKNGELSGGYNLNSLWLNKDKVGILPKDESLYSSLASVFDASIYGQALTSKSGNEYLAKEGLQGFPVPALSFNDEDPFATASMSVYFCLDTFSDKENYKKQYDSKTHKMPYSNSLGTKNVDYIAKQSNEMLLYGGEDFVMAKMGIENLEMSFYLPNDESSLPSSILPKALDGAYAPLTYFDEETKKDSSIYDITIKAPYFKLKNDISLKEKTLSDIFPHASACGLNERIAYGLDGPIRLIAILQQSVMSFDYNGFYSCSVTSVDGGPGSVNQGKRYTLSLSHPYLWSVNQPSIKVGSSYVSLPLVIGEIVDPAYE